MEPILIPILIVSIVVVVITISYYTQMGEKPMKDFKINDEITQDEFLEGHPKSTLKFGKNTSISQEDKTAL